MDDSALLIAGVGGLGCTWANRAHQTCSGYADLVLIDAEKNSLMEQINSTRDSLESQFIQFRSKPCHTYSVKFGHSKLHFNNITLKK